MSDLGTLLTKAENKIFASMVRLFPAVFKGRLYRDGVPVPDVYLAAAVRVLFVFREPNLKPQDWEMRRQVREFAKGGTSNQWWDTKVPRLGHAVVHALRGERPSYPTFQRLVDREERTRECLFPFGFLQIKKVGGGGKAIAAEIRGHAREYCRFLEEQVMLYKPHLIVGCGLGGDSPARLLNQYVLADGKPRRTRQGFKWWRFVDPRRPVAMLEFYHPSAYLSPQRLHRDLSLAVGEVARNVGL